ncbi:MAG TPA: LptE family protein [Prolixibacteraceae bacterium]|nr:LptE family protein [Prolixibacteraceae bacterium]HPS12217.1 LptE family protein [Prolixibacteraceae bacterium]
MNRIGKILLIGFIVVVADSCKINYTFTGASISPEVKTYTIYDFTDNLRMNPTLTDYFVEQLRDKFTRQTSLDYKTDGGDLEFEGAVTGYDVKPVSIKSNDTAASNRLTVKVKVKFTNNKDHTQDFETEFSEYEDFESSQILSDVESTLVEDIVKKMIDDIYNKSVANW